MVFFAVAREGLETVFFLLAVFQQSEGPAAPIGALLGLVLAIIVGWLIYTGSMRLNLGAFFRWTGLFILVVAAGILANSVQALHEAGVWNHLQTVLSTSARRCRWTARWVRCWPACSVTRMRRPSAPWVPI
jgi:high-affinity iron transporter